MNQTEINRQFEAEKKMTFKAWCKMVKARRAANCTPEGHARLAALIAKARDAIDNLRDITTDMAVAADGIGRGSWYASKTYDNVAEVEGMLNCVEEQLERAKEAQDGRAGENDRASQD